MSARFAANEQSRRAPARRLPGFLWGMLLLLSLQVLLVDFTQWGPLHVQAQQPATAAPPNVKKIAEDISAFVNSTLTQILEQKNTNNASQREVAVIFKQRSNATELEKLGAELLSLFDLRFITRLLTAEQIELLKKLDIVDVVVEEKPVRASGRITGLASTANSTNVT
ncbi:hypothetical protein THASP1DRAFT_25878, partial [Thamnocephalis sphaerospora]